MRDESGSYLVITALTIPLLVGALGLGVDVGVWFNAKQALQGAADSAAASAAASLEASNANDVTLEAKAIAASYGFVDGQNSVSISVNRPPSSGPHASSQNAVEVILSQPQRRFFSAIWSSAKVPISARAVALRYGGAACVLALDSVADGAITAQGNTHIVLNGCSLFSDSSSSSSVTVGGSAQIAAQSAGAVGEMSGASKISTTDGLTTGDAALANPYASVSVPSFSGCDYTSYSATKTVTMSPGVYCGGVTINANADVTMDPGIYYIDQGSLTINGNASVTGAGVTIIFTSSTGKSYATATINGGATINLTAPTSGPTAGIVLFGDPKMPVGTSFKLNGDSTQLFNGAVYIPEGAVEYAGGSAGTSACSQLIADTITFKGDAGFAVNCANSGTKPIGSSGAQLVE